MVQPLSMTLLHWFAGFLMFALAIVLMIACFRLHRPLKLNVILVMFVCHVLMQFFASVVLVFYDGTFAAATFFFVCAATAILIPIGGLLGDTMLPVTPERRRSFQHAPLPSSIWLRRKTLCFFLLFFGFCLILFLLYIMQMKMMPLYGLVSGSLNAEAADIARREAKSLGRFFGMGLLFFMPFLFLQGFLGLSYFRDILVKMLCVIAMVIAFIYNAWSAAKTPVALLFCLAVIVLLLKKDETDWNGAFRNVSTSIKKIFRKKRRRIYILLIFLGLLMIGYPVFIFLFKPAAQQGVNYLLQHVFLRVVWKPAINSFTAIEAFPDTLGYTYFTDIKSLTKLMGWEYFDLSEKISVYKGQPAFSNAPPTAIGNFYAQGGWPVLIGGVLFASALFKVIENIIYRAPKTLPHVALYVLLLWGAFRFSWANFHTILASELIFPMVVMLFIWTVIRRVRWYTII